MLSGRSPASSQRLVSIGTLCSLQLLQQQRPTAPLSAFDRLQEGEPAQQQPERQRVEGHAASGDRAGVADAQRRQGPASISSQLQLKRQRLEGDAASEDSAGGRAKGDAQQEQQQQLQQQGPASTSGHDTSFLGQEDDSIPVRYATHTLQGPGALMWSGGEK